MGKLVYTVSFPTLSATDNDAMSCELYSEFTVRKASLASTLWLKIAETRSYKSWSMVCAMWINNCRTRSDIEYSGFCWCHCLDDRIREEFKCLSTMSGTYYYFAVLPPPGLCTYRVWGMPGWAVLPDILQLWYPINCWIIGCMNIAGQYLLRLFISVIDVMIVSSTLRTTLPTSFFICPQCIGTHGAVLGRSMRDMDKRCNTKMTDNSSAVIIKILI